MTFHDWSNLAICLSWALFAIAGSLLTLFWLWWVNGSR